jgi:hypothetical protein
VGCEASVRLKNIHLLIILCLLTATTPKAIAQPQQGLPSAAHPVPEDAQRARLERNMAKKANLERQAQLQRDTDRLVDLTTELKHYVDKSNENILSIEVMKKAEQIEKLAHSVKEKMKGNN